MKMIKEKYSYALGLKGEVGICKFESWERILRQLSEK
jgi:hypothetical protein